VTKEQTTQKEDIKQQLQKLREQASTANAQIKKFIENRNQLNEQVKKAREEIARLKNERDSINDKVKTLKQQREAIRTKSVPITEEINGIKEKISELKKKLPRASHQELQEEHDAIEWKISTTSLDLQEEKMLIENVKQLEIQLSGYKKIDVQRNKIKDLIAQRKTFDDQADAVHKELTDLANKSQEIHSLVVEKVNAVKISRAQADSAHQAFLKTKEEQNPLYEKITELGMQLRGLNEVIREEGKAKRIAYEEEAKQRQQTFAEKQQATKEKEQAIKEKLGAEARDKLQKGEKLSWNEFQLVMGEDDLEDEETKN
jgi:phosphoserine phosphatase